VQSSLKAFLAEVLVVVGVDEDGDVVVVVVVAVDVDVDEVAVVGRSLRPRFLMLEKLFSRIPRKMTILLLRKGTMCRGILFA
jgi:hypothetical protein